jgi:hypothetical protein
MSWKDLLSNKETITVPWTGGRIIRGAGRKWNMIGASPEEHGWHQFEVSGDRRAVWKGKGEPDMFWSEYQNNKVTGYMVGSRIIPDDAAVDPDPDKVFEQSIHVDFVEPGLDRFSRAEVVNYEQSGLIYASTQFPIGPENEVLQAFLSREGSVSDIPNVTPALDLAFRFESQQRDQREERVRRLEEKRLEEERRNNLRKMIGTGEGRRELARVDFGAAATAALGLSGSTLLDHRPSYNRNEIIVQFRYRNRRFECVVEKDTLHVVDSGICLTGNDRLFTLESLPPVIGNAIDVGVLHVFRHVDDYTEFENDHDDDW